MANPWIEEEKHQKHNSSQVLGPQLLYSLWSVSEATEVGEKG